MSQAQVQIAYQGPAVDSGRLTGPTGHSEDAELMEFTDTITAMRGVTKVCPAVLLEKLK